MMIIIHSGLRVQEKEDSVTFAEIFFLLSPANPQHFNKKIRHISDSIILTVKLK